MRILWGVILLGDPWQATGIRGHRNWMILQNAQDMYGLSTCNTLDTSVVHWEVMRIAPYVSTSQVD